MYNSCTSNNPDFVVDDYSLQMDVLPDEYTPDVYTQRHSGDAGHVNNNGILLLDVCKQRGFHIMNGWIGTYYGVGRYTLSLRKHAYSNIQKISPPKTDNFQTKIL